MAQDDHLRLPGQLFLGVRDLLLHGQRLLQELLALQVQRHARSLQQIRDRTSHLCGGDLQQHNMVVDGFQQKHRHMRIALRANTCRWCLPLTTVCHSLVQAKGHGLPT